MTNEIDWANLGFDIHKTKSCIKFIWKNGAWGKGALTADDTVTMSAYASVIHYGQGCFEGLKAFRMKDGQIRVFRPTLNQDRMKRSCLAASMPFPTQTMFLEAIQTVVKDNSDWVPPFGSNGAMYIRPFVFGSGPMLGLSPSGEYHFMVLVNPVGDYYKGGVNTPSKALIMHGFDRAAPNGTGSVKLAGNYAPCLAPTMVAKALDYTVLLFLDPQTGTLIEEFASSNFAALTKPDANGIRTYVTPKSSSVLASVTNRSLLELAALAFHWKVERRAVPWQEVLDGGFDEIAACGTAVVITTIGKIDRQIPIYKLKAETKTKTLEQIWDDSEEAATGYNIESFEVKSDFSGFQKLYRAYRDIQTGEATDNYNWMWPPLGIQ